MSLDSPPLDSYWYWFAQKCLSSPPRRAEAVWSASSVPAGAKLHFARHSFKKWALRIKDSLNWAASGRTKEVTNGNTGSNSVLRSKSLFKSGVWRRHRKIKGGYLFWFQGTPPGFQIKIPSAAFLFLSPFQPQFMLSPAAHDGCSVYSSRGKEEDNCLFLVVTFLQFDLGSQPQQIRATDASRLLETEGFFFLLLLFARHWEVVFQTRDYAHCDLPKHTVLAIFSWNRMKATLKRQMRLICPRQGNRRHIWERVISDSITVPF